jgi:hypothetical protein
MVTKTFQARVINGQLQHSEALDAFEGQKAEQMRGPASG